MCKYEEYCISQLNISVFLLFVCLLIHLIFSDLADRIQEGFKTRFLVRSWFLAGVAGSDRWRRCFYD